MNQNNIFGICISAVVSGILFGCNSGGGSGGSSGFSCPNVPTGVLTSAPPSFNLSGSATVCSAANAPSVGRSIPTNAVYPVTYSGGWGSCPKTNNLVSIEFNGNTYYGAFIPNSNTCFISCSGDPFSSMSLSLSSCTYSNGVFTAKFGASSEGFSGVIQMQ